MATLTKAALQALLARRARLKSPRFKIRRADNKLIGAVISDTFKEMSNRERQRLMWEAIEAALDEGAARRVGMLLGYTDDEWDEPLEGMPSPANAKPRARMKAG